MNIRLLFPGIAVCICIVIYLVLTLQQKKHVRTTGKDREKQQSVQTAQEFTNVKDIKDMFLYTKDNYLISYIKVQPVTIELLTKNEKKMLARNLTSEFSQEKEPFKFIAVSRSVDIEPLVEAYSELLSNSTEQIQKELLRNETRVITDFSLSGEVVEREFYYLLWARGGEEELLRKRTKDLAGRIEGCGLGCHILEAGEIIKLCNLVNNPAFAAVETINSEATIPFISLYE